MPPLSATVLQNLRVAAARQAGAQEADDLIQDVLLAAIAQGRTAGDPNFLAWAKGAIRLRSHFVARSAVRRRQREAAYSFLVRHSQTSPAWRLPEDFIASLPPSQRIVAQLVNLDMGRKEIAYLLSLTQVALRQRIAGLRKAMHTAGVRPVVLQRGRGDAGNGPARRALKAALPPRPIRQFAVRDPDGTTILIAGGHVSDSGGN